MQTLAPSSASASTIALPIPVLPPVTMADFPFKLMVPPLVPGLNTITPREIRRKWSSAVAAARELPEEIGQLLPYTNRVRHRGHRRAHRTDARRGRKSPRSSRKIFFPVGARVLASVAAGAGPDDDDVVGLRHRRPLASAVVPRRWYRARDAC